MSKHHITLNLHQKPNSVRKSITHWRERKNVNPDWILSPLVGFTAFQLYYSWTDKGFSFLEMIIRSLDKRPYVYRVLVPLLSRSLEQLVGISAIYCLMFLVILFSIGLYFAVKYLYGAFSEDAARSSLISFICCELFFVFILGNAKVYDIPSAFFFTLSLALLARDKVTAYLLLFPIATLNKETTVLLSLFWAITFFNKTNRFQFIAQGIYQVVVFVVIRWILTSLFADLPGSSFLWMPAENLAAIINSPVDAALLLAGFGIAIYMAVKGWNDKPSFLRTAFLVIFPLQVIQHVTVGILWEIRVYAECFSIVFLVASWNIQPVFSSSNNSDLKK